MKIDYAEARKLLRRSRSGALGSHSVAAPGYPFVTLLPYVLDEACQPLFLLSGLAEHTRNLVADPRASFLVADGDGGPLQQARLTLIGRVKPVSLSDAGVARYLRYSPESSDYLALGDFRFFRMEPEKVRYIGGFARMGGQMLRFLQQFSIRRPSRSWCLLLSVWRLLACLCWGWISKVWMQASAAIFAVSTCIR